MYKTITGHLREVSNDETYLETEDGQYFEVLGAARIPKNRLIALTVIDGRYPCEVTSTDPAYTYINKYAGDPVPPAKHIGIFKLIPWTCTDEQEEDHWASVEAAAVQVERYLRTYARHIWDIQVRGYCFRGDDTVQTGPPHFAAAEINEFIQGHDMEGFEPQYFHVWGGSNGKWCGLAYMGGQRSVTFTNRNCGVRTMVHELMHNFTVGHAGLRKVDGSDTEYGDTSSIMGGGTDEVRGMNSAHVLRLNLDTAREIKVIDQSAAVWVAPIEMGEHGMHDGEYQHVLLRVPGFKDISISTRKSKGWPYAQPSNTEDKLFLHEIDGASTKLLQPLLRRKESRLLDNGVRVYYRDVENESALVEFQFDKFDTPEPPDPPIGFPAPIPSAHIMDTHGGAWYDPDFSGQGFDIHIRNGTLGLFWYAFNQGDGSRRFFLGNARLVRRGLTEDTYAPVTFDLLTTTDGTFDDPMRYREYKVGTAQLYFLDNNRGVFNYATEEHGRGSIEIEPVILADDPRSGVYADLAKLGSGFSIDFFDLNRRGRVAAFWYTYGPKPYRPPFAGTEVQDQRWFSCEGVEMPDGSYQLTFYEVLGARWVDLREADFTVAGTGKLVVLESGDLEFSYNLQAVGLEKQGSYTLTRIF